MRLIIKWDRLIHWTKEGSALSFVLIISDNYQPLNEFTHQAILRSLASTHPSSVNESLNLRYNVRPLGGQSVKRRGIRLSRYYFLFPVYISFHFAAHLNKLNENSKILGKEIWASIFRNYHWENGSEIDSLNLTRNKDESRIFFAVQAKLITIGNASRRDKCTKNKGSVWFVWQGL